MSMYPVKRDDLFFPLEQTFNKFFEEFFVNKSNTNVAKSNIGYPKINSYVDGDYFKLAFAIPGVTSDDLEVEYGKNRTVTIKGRSSKKYQTSSDAMYYMREVRLSSFERTIYLPDNIEGEPEHALLSDGILTLSWRLTPQENNERIRISVKSE
jgi:HSP20 family molecular chaperone IbpA